MILKRLETFDQFSFDTKGNFPDTEAFHKVADKLYIANLIRKDLDIPIEIVMDELNEAIRVEKEEYAFSERMDEDEAEVTKKSRPMFSAKMV